MSPADSFLWIYRAAALAATAYLFTAGLVVLGRLRYDRRQRLLQRIERILSDESGEPDPAARRARAVAALSDVSLRAVLHLAAESSLTPAAAEVLSETVIRRRGLARVLRDADTPARPRHPWRRIAALRALAATRGDEKWPALARALETGSRPVFDATVTMVGAIADRRAAALLVAALRRPGQARSRVATVLDACPLDLADLLAPLLDADDPGVRYWALMLMQRYPDAPGLRRGTIELSADRNDLVRKAALATLGAIGGEGAQHAAMERLDDAVDYVRGQAARTLGALGVPGSARAILPLLADRSWWVRAAAKQSLEALGPDVLAAVVPYLTHRDPFARNGAAEVLQNLGTFERLLTLEVVSGPNPARRDTLERLAQAGGVRMWDSALARLDPEQQQRARALLASIDLERAAATIGPGAGGF